MLAQNFKTALDLQITEIEKQSLIKVMGMIERDEIVVVRRLQSDTPKGAYLHMPAIKRIDEQCGSVGCICGWANIVSDGQAFPEINRQSGSPTVHDMLNGHRTHAIQDLFGITDSSNRLISKMGESKDNVVQAIRNYLTIGEAKWGSILGITK